MPINEDRWVSHAQLVGLVGEAGAERIIAVFGGVRIWVPRPESTESSSSFAAFAEKLGPEIAHSFCAAFGDMRVTVPVPARLNSHQEILRLRAAGMKAGEIARKVGYSERHVYKVLASEKDGPLAASSPADASSSTLDVLSQCSGNITGAARRLRVSRMTIYRRLGKS